MLSNEQKNRLFNFNQGLIDLLDKNDLEISFEEYKAYLLDKKIEAVPLYWTSRAIAVLSGSGEMEMIERDN